MPATNIVPMPSVLEAHAKRLHKLMADWANNSIAIGKELAAAQANFPPVKITAKGRPSRPGWLNWLKANVGISPSHAINLMQVAKRFGETAATFKTSQKVLVLLSQVHTPESARQEVIERIKKGEKIGRKETSRIIREHKLPKPTEANKQAKETGQPVQASDGYIYFGTSKEDAQAGEDRRTIVYGVKDAIEALAEVELSPINFIKFMLPHQRWERGEEKKIEKARQWLNELAKEWDRWEEQ